MTDAEEGAKVNQIFSSEEIKAEVGNLVTLVMRVCLPTFSF